MNRKRYVGQIRYTAGAEESIELPMDNPICWIEVMIYAKYTVATADAESPSPYGNLALIEAMRHEIQFADRQTEEPKRLTLPDWFWRLYFRHNAEPRRDVLALTQAQHVVRGKLQIPYSQMSPVRSKYPPLAAQQLNHNQLFLRWLPVTSILTAGGGGTVVLDECYASVWVIEDLSTFEPDLALPVYYETTTNKVPTAAGEQVKIKLPAGFIHCDVLMRTRDNSVEANTLLDWFDFMFRGSSIRRAQWYEELYDLPFFHEFDQRNLMGVATAEVPYASPDGLIYIDWDREGDIDDWIDTRLGDLVMDGPVAVYTADARVDLSMGYLCPVEEVEVA